MSIEVPHKSVKIDCWLDLFESRDSFDLLNKGFLEKSFQTFDHLLSVDNCKNALLEHP